MMIGTDERARSCLQTSNPWASGSPRSSSTRSAGGADRAAAAVLHEGHVEALAAKPGRQWLADGIVVFDHENLHCSGSFPQAIGLG